MTPQEVALKKGLSIIKIYTVKVKGANEEITHQAFEYLDKSESSIANGAHSEKGFFAGYDENGNYFSISAPHDTIVVTSEKQSLESAVKLIKRATFGTERAVDAHTAKDRDG